MNIILVSSIANMTIFSPSFDLHELISATRYLQKIATLRHFPMKELHVLNTTHLFTRLPKANSKRHSLSQGNHISIHFLFYILPVLTCPQA